MVSLPPRLGSQNFPGQRFSGLVKRKL